MIRRATTDDIPSIRQMADVAFRDTYKDILSITLKNFYGCSLSILAD